MLEFGVYVRVARDKLYSFGRMRMSYLTAIGCGGSRFASAVQGRQNTH